MHGGAQHHFVTYGYAVTPADRPEERRRPGRPRKWNTEAERARAYRERKAEEHASVDELRVERRALRRQLSDAERSGQRAQAALERSNLRAERLAADLERAKERLRVAAVELSRLEARNEQLSRHAAERPVEGRSELNRQQRRAMERNRAKRGR